MPRSSISTTGTVYDLNITPTNVDFTCCQCGSSMQARMAVFHTACSLHAVVRHPGWRIFILVAVLPVYFLGTRCFTGNGLLITNRTLTVAAERSETPHGGWVAISGRTCLMSPACKTRWMRCAVASRALMRPSWCLTFSWSTHTTLMRLVRSMAHSATSNLALRWKAMATLLFH